MPGWEKWETRKDNKGKPIQFHLPSFPDKTTLINISFLFGSIMQPSKEREGNRFLTYRSPYIYKQEKLPVEAAASLSEVAECFPCRNWMYCSHPSEYLRLEISHRVQTTADIRLNISS